MTTRMWRIMERPQYTVEQTPGAWVLWGPCECGGNNEECPSCGGTGEKIVDSCGFQPGGTAPSDPNMIARYIGLDRWTPERIQ